MGGAAACVIYANAMGMCGVKIYCIISGFTARLATCDI